ncbi:MAG TPA: DMT family transporter [Thermoanaerobaculia bacterium]|jgi:drug/metabolite transporter (DMT)-like permease|nr:DMT family transporter [Thermoanaerobaculia bacterium]
MRTFLLASAALVGFAANSLLCRLALAPRSIDASSFTLVRLASGALMLAILVRLARQEGPRTVAGSWAGAAALFAYAAGFSFAYLRLGAGTGALVLFGAVQLTMLGWGIFRGERPGPLVFVGTLMALAGLVVLTFPGLSAPDPLGAALMAGAGVSWGVYSLRGRGGKNPLATTAGNFARSVPMAAALSLAALAAAAPHASPRGVALAVASGALASGVGYSLWYAALRDLTATRAAVAQLVVPVLAAFGGVLLLGERFTGRLIGAGTLILAGVALALLRRSATGKRSA